METFRIRLEINIVSFKDSSDSELGPELWADWFTEDDHYPREDGPCDSIYFLDARATSYTRWEKIWR